MEEMINEYGFLTQETIVSIVLISFFFSVILGWAFPFLKDVILSLI